MGTSVTVAQFAGKISTCATRMAEANAPTLLRAARESVAKGSQVQPYKFLRNVGERGSMLSVRSAVKTTEFVTYAQGPWQILDNPAKAHVVTSKHAAGTRKSRSAIVYGGGSGLLKLKISQSKRKVGPTIKGGHRAVIKTPEGYRAYAKIPARGGKKT